MPDPPGATGPLGLDLIDDQSGVLGVLEEGARTLEAGADSMAQRFQPIRSALEVQGFYSGLLERACDDAATTVRTNYLLWKAAGSYKTDAEILVGVLAELVVGFALDSPAIQRQVSELIGRTLSLADKKARNLAAQRAPTKPPPRALTDRREEIARLREHARVTSLERRRILYYLGDLDEDISYLDMDRILAPLAKELDVPLTEIIGLRRIDDVVDAVYRWRIRPLARLDADLLMARETLAQAERAAKTTQRASTSGKTPSEIALRNHNDPAKQAKQQMVFEFAGDVTQELRAATKASRAAAKSTPKSAPATTPRATPPSTEIVLDTGGKQSDPMLAVLERVIGAAQQQMSAYQELVLRTRLLVDDLLELRSIPGLEAAAEDQLAEVATFVNGIPAADAPVKQGVGAPDSPATTSAQDSSAPQSPTR